MMEELRKNRREQRKCRITRIKVLLFVVNVFVFQTIITEVAELFKWSAMLESAPTLKAILLATVVTGFVWKFWDKLKESIFLGILLYFSVAFAIDAVFVYIATEFFNVTNMFVLFMLTVVAFYIDMFIFFGVRHVTDYIKKYAVEEKEYI